jgi:hypothetical protein
MFITGWKEKEYVVYTCNRIFYHTKEGNSAIHDHMDEP